MANTLMAIAKIKNLTLKDISALTDIPYRTIQEYSYRHDDLGNIPARKVYDIAKALDVDIEYLIGIKNLEGLVSSYKKPSFE